jgi:SAM-dependent methyltransferase
MRYGGSAYYEQASVWSRERYLDSVNELQRFRLVADCIPASVESLLDAGTGNGAFLAFLESKQTPLVLLGVDPSTAAISSSLCASTIIIGSADHLPFENNSFDIVTALEVLEHLPYGVYERSLAEFERLAKAFILISVPYRERRRNVLCPYCGCAFHPYFHLRSYDEDGLKRLFRSFSLVKLVKVPVQERLPLPTPQFLWTDLLSSRPRLMSGDTVCPSCGYQRSSSEREATNDSSTACRWDQTKERIKRLMPNVNKTRWVLALYMREV